jgi:endonuclease G, mitochondrial
VEWRFLCPTRKLTSVLSNYVVSIDSVERLTGLNFFPLLSKEMEERIEAKADFEAWQTQAKVGDVEPIKATDLPKGHFNTEQARMKIGQTVTIVGKVVSTKYLAKSQSTFLNLDQSYPNVLFTVYYLEGWPPQFQLSSGSRIGREVCRRDRKSGIG